MMHATIEHQPYINEKRQNIDAISNIVQRPTQLISLMVLHTLNLQQTLASSIGLEPT